MQNDRLYRLFLKSAYTDLEVTLDDGSQKIVLNVHKVVLIDHSEYFEKLLLFGEDLDTITLKVPNVAATQDLILSFYGKIISDTTWPYTLAMAKCRDYFGLEALSYDLPETIQPIDYDFILELCGIIGFDENNLRILNKNLSIHYDLDTLSSDFIDAMISQNQSYRMITKGSNNNSTTVLDVKTGQIIHSYHAIHSIYFSPCNKYIVTLDTYTNILDANTNEILYTFAEEINSIAFPSSGDSLAVATLSSIKIFDLNTHQYISTLNEDIYLSKIHLQYSQDGAYLIANTNWASVLYDIKTGKCIQRFDKIMVFTNHPKYLISVNNASTEVIKIWNIETAKYSTYESTDFATNLSTKRFEKNIPVIPYICQKIGTKYEIHDIEKDKVIAEIDFDKIYNIIFSSDNQYIAFGVNSDVLIINILTGEIKHEYRNKYHKGTYEHNISFTPLSKYFILQTNGMIEILKLEDNTSKFFKEGYWGPRYAHEYFTFTPDSKYIITRPTEYIIEIRDIETLELMHTVHNKSYNIDDNVYYNENVLRLVKYRAKNKNN